MPYFSVSSESRIAAAGPFNDDILCDAMERWPNGEIEVRQPEAYFLLPAQGKDAIALGTSFRQAEASLRKALLA
jgi:hypothetical protein